MSLPFHEITPFTWIVATSVIIVFTLSSLESFSLLQIPQWFAIVYVALAIVGSFVNITIGRVRNIPGFRRKWVVSVDRVRVLMPEFVAPQQIKLQLNVGTVVLPIVVSILLMAYLPTLILQAFIALLICSILVFWTSRIDMRGAIVPFWVPLAVATLVSWMLMPSLTSFFPLAFISGTVSVCTGGELMNLRRLRHLSKTVIRFGGPRTQGAVLLCATVPAFLA